MILGGINKRPSSGETTLDDLFRRAAERRPDALALSDPDDRGDICGSAPRKLRYADVDRAASRLAFYLRELGLPADSVIAVQLPNIVENVIALLGIMRAGMIAAPLPLLWRQAEAVAALGKVGAKAILTCDRAGSVNHGELAMQIAAETFAIRFLCGFGSHLPDGIVPLDPILDPAGDTDLANSGQTFQRNERPADHVALVTFDITPTGLVPVARNHHELIAGGLAIMSQARMERDARIVCALTLSSFTGIACSIVPWLLLGGTLTLHHPFNPLVLEAQCGDADAIILPGPVMAHAAESGFLKRSGVTSAIAVWRNPERLASQPPAPYAWTDVLSFGETGFLTQSRAAGATSAPLKPGSIQFPPQSPDALTLIELARSEAGTIALRGAMVPNFAFPPGIERGGGAHYQVGPDRFVDTFYACRRDKDGTLTPDAPPPGLVTVGGYRFVLRELQELIARIEHSGTLAALPDALSGHRLAGTSSDRAALCVGLASLGLNPLILNAFRDRRERSSAA